LLLLNYQRLTVNLKMCMAKMYTLDQKLELSSQWELHFFSETSLLLAFQV